MISIPRRGMDYCRLGISDGNTHSDANHPDLWASFSRNTPTHLTFVTCRLPVMGHIVLNNINGYIKKLFRSENDEISIVIDVSGHGNDGVIGRRRKNGSSGWRNPA